ncbi:MAG TPA: signal peptidase I, partial [Pilimelia sp.]|nr:signal peptidase I [Pilimelia sp.]
ATLPTAPVPTPAPLAPLTATLPPALTHYAAPAAAPPHHAPAGYPPAPAAAAPPWPAPAVATGAPAGPAATPPGGAPAPAAPRTSVRDRAWNAGVTGLTFLRRLALALAIGMVAWSLAPVAFGWQTAVVVTGSMHPAVRVGDVVATAPVRSADVSRLPAGSVLLMDDPAKPGTLLLHRLVKVRSDGTLVTKGDANRSRDSTPVPPQNVRGIARLRVPAVGLPVLWARQGEWAPLAAVVLLFGIVVFWQPPRPQRP